MNSPRNTILPTLVAALIFALPDARAAFPTVALKPVCLQQIHSPTTITYAPDGSGRLFVCDQLGKIYIIQGGMLLPTPFLDLSSHVLFYLPPQVPTGYSERGLLCIAFHPGFANPGSPGYRKFYLNYTKTWVSGTDADPLGPLVGTVPTLPPSLPGDCVSVIAEFQVSAGDPNVAVPSSERRLLFFTQPQGNHNGGQIEFGPETEIGPSGERYLYIGVGDGGSQEDNNRGHTGGDNTAPRPTAALGNAQDKTRLFGKILRIDPLGTNGPGGQYGIPVDNPFVGVGGGVREEIYSYGMRNPWKFSFDKRAGGTNRLFCGDVGGGRTEEINLIVSGGNYGWRYKEGVELPTFSSGAMTNPMTLPPAEVAAMIDPVARYAHPGAGASTGLPELGYSVTGGYVYRGAAIPALQGKFVFGDYGQIGLTDGRLMGLEETVFLSGAFTLTQALPIMGKPLAAGGALLGERILCLGEDESGEIYVGLKTNNGVMQLGTDGLPAGGIYKIVPVTAGTLVANPSKDNSIFKEAPNNSNGQGVTLFAGVTGPSAGNSPRRALMAFDVSSLPAGATVSSATLQLAVALGQGAANPMTLRRVTQPWGEGTSIAPENGGQGVPAMAGDASWNHRLYNTDLWTTAGGAFIATASASAEVSGFGSYTWTSAQLAADVQGWVTTPTTNNGWILIGDETGTFNAKRVYSREANSESLRPKLTVNFIAPPALTHREVWLQTYFPVGQFVDDLADLDGDGIGNGIEYSYGFSPVTADPADAGLQVSSAEDGPNTVFTFAFRRDPRATDLTYALETSSDLMTWSNPPIVHSVGGADSSGSGFVSDSDIFGEEPMRLVTAQETLLTPANRFVRLRISRAP